MSWICFGASHAGKLRANNEDCWFADADSGVFAVADGMGGANAGEVASKIAVDTIIKAAESAPLDSQQLLAAIEDANQAIYMQSNTVPGRSGMGTTLVVVAVHGDELLIASTGDSRAYLMRGARGRLELVTKDQSWVEEVGRPSGIAEEELAVHPMRHVLTMALGVGNSLTIRYRAIAVPVGALLLLTTDGTHGVAPFEEMERILRDNYDDLAAAAGMLIDSALHHGGPDNITVVIARRVS